MLGCISTYRGAVPTGDIVFIMVRAPEVGLTAKMETPLVSLSATNANDCVGGFMVEPPHATSSRREINERPRGTRRLGPPRELAPAPPAPKASYSRLPRAIRAFLAVLPRPWDRLPVPTYAGT